MESAREEDIYQISAAEALCTITGLSGQAVKCLLDRRLLESLQRGDSPYTEVLLGSADNRPARCVSRDASVEDPPDRGLACQLRGLTEAIVA